MKKETRSIANLCVRLLEDTRAEKPTSPDDKAQQDFEYQAWNAFDAYTGYRSLEEWGRDALPPLTPAQIIASDEDWDEGATYHLARCITVAPDCLAAAMNFKLRFEPNDEFWLEIRARAIDEWQRQEREKAERAQRLRPIIVLKRNIQST